MKVTLDPALLEQQTAFDRLDDLRRLMATGQHVWSMPIADIDAIEGSAWLQSDQGRTGRDNRDLFQRAATDAITTRGATLVAAEGSDPPSQCHRQALHIGSLGDLDDALRQLADPAQVWVEDDESDRRFLDCLINAYGRNDLAQALTNGWLECAHAGGKGGIPKRINRAITAGARPGRLAAFFDSDRLYPGHPSDTVKAAKKLADARPDVTVIVLRKRESENYLPLAALDAARQKRAYIAFRARLSPDQQDHFDMKTGFVRAKTVDAKDREKTKVELQPAQRNLYAGLNSAVLKDLVGGFSGGCGALFQHAHVTRDGLEARCRKREPEAEGELLRLLLSLEALL